MTLINLFTRFARDEDGAVTVDWVVLTAALVGIAIAVGSVLNDGLGTVTDQINTSLEGEATGLATGVTIGTGTE